MSESEKTPHPERPEHETVNEPAQDDATDRSTPEPAAASDTNSPDTNALQQEVAELKDQLLRSHAELDNFRRRSRREAEDSQKYQALPVIRDLLPGIDNLQRAIDATEQTGDAQNLVEGVKMVAKQFQDVLKAHQAESIDPTGQPFDPNLHEALSQVPSAEHEPMTVLQVVEQGYRIHDRVIRPAKVIVSSAAAEPAGDSQDNTSSEQGDS